MPSSFADIVYIYVVDISPGGTTIVRGDSDNDAESSKSHILVVDQGTHATRALLFSAGGELLCANQRDVALDRQDEHVEQDAQELLDSVEDVISDTCRRFPSEIACMGLATQRSTVVAWDRDSGRPLAPAISWQDRRGADWLNRVSPPADVLTARTGLRASPHYGVAKMHWWLEHDPAIQKAANEGRLVMGPLAGFLVSRLVSSQPARVDTTNAARTLLLDIDAGDWDTSLLKRYGIAREYLPEVKPVRADYGRLNRFDIPVTALSGDQTAALFVDGLPPTGRALVNIGSGAFILAVTGRQRIPVPGLLAGQAANTPDGPLHYVEGTVNGAGTALEWLAQQADTVIDPTALDDILAGADAPPVFVNAVGGLGSPWWADTAPRFADETSAGKLPLRDRIAGVLESIAFLVAENVSRMRDHGIHLETLLFTGGLSRVDRLCQTIVDLVALPGLRLPNPEATARGTAWLAAEDPASWIATARLDFTPQSRPPLFQRQQRFRQLLQESLDR